LDWEVIWEYYNINPPQLPALPTRILLDKPMDSPIKAIEVSVPPGISDAVDEEDLVDSFSADDEDDFFAEKKVLIKLKRLFPQHY
jgi:hypothetical protein